MTTPTLTCLCPVSTEPQLLSAINNNLCLLFKTMSGGTFQGRFVYPIGVPGQCGCTEIQMLSALNNNIALFFNEFSGGGADPIDNTIHHWSDLANVTTVGVGVPLIKVWVDDDAGYARVTQLSAGTDATDTASGIQRPADFNAVTNAKVWYDRTL